MEVRALISFHWRFGMWDYEKCNITSVYLSQGFPIQCFGRFLRSFFDCFFPIWEQQNISRCSLQSDFAAETFIFMGLVLWNMFPCSLLRTVNFPSCCSEIQVQHQGEAPKVWKFGSAGSSLVCLLQLVSHATVLVLSCANPFSEEAWEGDPVAERA